MVAGVVGWSDEVQIDGFTEPLQNQLSATEIGENVKSVDFSAAEAVF